MLEGCGNLLRTAEQHSRFSKDPWLFNLGENSGITGKFKCNGRRKNWGSSKLNICHQKASNREMSYKSLKKAMSNTKMHPSFNEQSISLLHSRGILPPHSLFCVSYFSLVSPLQVCWSENGKYCNSISLSVSLRKGSLPS